MCSGTDVRHEHAAGARDVGGILEYWERICRDELEINQATLDIFAIRIPKPKFVLMPTPVWDQLFRPMVAGQRWIAAGLFDPAVREKAGMRWTPSDEVLLRLFGKAVEIAFSAVPDEIRLHPRALAAYRRAAGRDPPTPRWWRRRSSWTRRATARACRCTTSRAASYPALPDTRRRPERSSNARARWCTPRSRWPGCGRPGGAATRRDLTRHLRLPRDN